MGCAADQKTPLERGWPLDGWFAAPLAPEHAAAKLAQVQAERRRGGIEACPLGCQLRELVARFWLGRPVQAQYAALARSRKDPECRALTELAYGQLLVSRKLSGATAHLERGFELAGPLLSAEGYFRVYRRHQLLAYLVLGPLPAPPQDLASLLREAAVIRRLQGGVRGQSRPATDPSDTEY